MFSVVGGLFGVAVLMLFAQPFARIATLFTVAEYFWFYVLGLGCAVVVSRGSALKGAFALLLGLLFSTVGLSPVHTEARFTFGRPELYQGINFIPAMVGLFGLSEVLRTVSELARGDRSSSAALDRIRPRRARSFARHVIDSFRERLRRLARAALAAARADAAGSAIGTLIGILPGAGADIAAWVSFGYSKRTSKNPEEYGRGSLEGVADAGAANNAALAGAWVPALTLGIPGDSITAIVLGIMMMKNLQPGPGDLREAGRAGAQPVPRLHPGEPRAACRRAGWPSARAAQLIRVPRHTLLPIIVLFCVLGSYAIGGSYFDVALMLAMGVLGFALERWQVPVGPVVLGIILGGPLEERFVQAHDGLAGLAQRVLRASAAAGLAVVALVVWLLPVVTALRGKKPVVVVAFHSYTVPK